MQLISYFNRLLQIKGESTMNYTNTTKKQSVARILIIVLFLVVVLGWNIAKMVKMPNYIFESISSFDVAKEYIVEPIGNDKNLGDIVPLERFANVIQWEGKKYEVYAYVFENADDVKAYYECVSDASYGDYYGTSMSGDSVTNMKYTAYCNNALFFVKGRNSAANLTEFLTWLTADFPLTIYGRQR